MSYYNGTYEEIEKALRYLADNERPRGGEQRFNSEHLFQLADEIAALRAENATLRERLALIESFKPEFTSLLPGSPYRTERPIDRARVDVEFARLRAEWDFIRNQYHYQWNKSAEARELTQRISDLEAARERLMGGGGET